MADTQADIGTPARAGEDLAARAQPLRGKVPALPLWQAQALCAFFGAPQRWPLREGGGWLEFFRAGPIDGETVTLEGDGARVRLQLDSGLALDADTGLHWSGYRGRSRVLAWSLAHESQLMKLSQALDVALIPVVDDGAASLRELQARGGEDDGLWLGFRILDGAGQARSRGHLRIPPGWVDRLLLRAEPFERARGDGDGEQYRDWSQLPVPVTLSWDGPSLRYAQWRQLRAGDVLVIGNYQRPPPVRALAPGLAWPLAPIADGWRIDGPPLTLSTHQETSAMSDPESAADAPEAATGPDVPIRLEFDLGRLECRYEDLAGFQPGYVFALPSRLEGANVVIRANGRDAGRGEIVAVGETLGVRLLSWS
ncbi:type III secretion system cytoplasmic ring protein SctQ [Lysobacter enzymogenes]|jgi:type III secretion system YscQ/HrcQ family protein|uniref:type III secretion system cytoplasmic ring protein SctQ n=1 Tax=Lysobacter enzymogenes TaxID=69 RepID=UPI001AF5E7CD|nr:type III secretion system cytoplasmic ring protein SctQ [Lysobacter enzymogenes]QQQ01588.1 type III secretion system cytoplasmic ring protein SctQ [Lysobacter enzymogenes]